MTRIGPEFTHPTGVLEVGASSFAYVDGCRYMCIWPPPKDRASLFHTYQVSFFANNYKYDDGYDGQKLDKSYNIWLTLVY